MQVIQGLLLGSLFLNDGKDATFIAEDCADQAKPPCQPE